MAMPGGQTLEDRIVAGRRALAGARWAEARDLLAGAVAQGAPASAMEDLSWAAWWLGDDAQTFGAREDAFRAYRAQGDRRGAARVAVWLASDFLDFRGEHAPAAGWLGRARRLLDGLEPSAEHGWMWLVEANLTLARGGDPADVAALARRATALGRGRRVPDLEAVGLGYEGLALVALGRVTDGMRALDEASALAAAEDFELALTPGWTLCCVVSACEGVGDLARASQWVHAMDFIAERWDARSLRGVCRSAMGNVLAIGGDWPAAEEMLVGAVDDLDATRPALAASGLVRLGELRARQGRVDEARELFERCGPSGAALLGLARLALGDGDATGALQTAERVLRRLPPTSVLDRLPAQELVARANAALGRLDEADAAAAAVAHDAAQLGTAYLVGRAHAVRAEAHAARGDLEDARCACEDAVDCLTEGAAPYDAALARLVLARVLLRLDRIAAATAAARAARDAFAALGATRDLRLADELLAGEAGIEAGARLGDLTARELDVLRLVALGLGDAQIAERLVLSPHTVHRHVANIRTKLRLPSRSAAVAYAARAGLL